MWKTAFKNFEGIWSAWADHIPSNFSKAVFHKFYLVHSWKLCPESFVPKVKVSYASYCWKRALKSIKTGYANKKKEYNMVITNLDKLLTVFTTTINPLLFISLMVASFIYLIVLFSAYRAYIFADIFTNNSNSNDSGSSRCTFLTQSNLKLHNIFATPKMSTSSHCS